METIVVLPGFISVLVLILLISALIEFLDKGKTFGGVFITRLAGVRGSTFATWLILCGILGIMANLFGGPSGGIVASMCSIFIGIASLAFLGVIDRISPRKRHKWPE